MKWDNAVYLSRVRDFICKQEDTDKVVTLLHGKLKKIKNSSIKKQSVVNSLNNFMKGSSPEGEYLEAYLQVIDELLASYGAIEVLNGAIQKESELELRQILLMVTKGKSLPSALKQYSDKPEVLRELTEIFYIIIGICFKGNSDPENSLTRFRLFLELMNNENGDNS